ncbi:SMODS-associated NUDIX domain-containing protein [Streptococcus sp. SS-4456]|uniref:SMODS-associated NUDIX domain-containing protein n=1 Tax=Streptococcus sp. SS-4456 TaxID=3072286 RepID=UPI002FCB367C
MEIIQDIFVNLIVAIISFLASTIFHNRRRVKIWCQSLLRWNKNIRLSCAYLFQIKHNDRYLLIRGRRIDQYQPVGGVYKYHDSFKRLKEELDLKDESETRFYEGGDLRLITKGKHLVKFLDWFDSRKNREVTVIRELIEELEPAGISIERLVKETQVEYLKTIKEPIVFSTHFQMDELKIFEIFEAEIPADILGKVLESEDYCIIEAEDIERNCFTKDGLSKRISATSKYII